VIPGEVELSLDLRHPEDEVRMKASRDAQQRAQEIATERSVSVAWTITQEMDAVVCDRGLSMLMSEALRAHQPETVLLHSGAGHDAAALSRITPVTMLFVRCKGGISHHPAESVSLEDVRVALAVLRDFLNRLSREKAT
jgi:allantoate deiminase